MNDIYLKQPLDLKLQISTLYLLLGQAVWAIQHLEDALNYSIAIKHPEATTKAKGDIILNSNRELTLGKAVRRAKKEKVYDGDFQKELEDFLIERNWLIHKCMRESVDEIGMILDAEKLFKRIKNIELLAVSLREAITNDMLNFVSSKGRDDICISIEHSYSQWQKLHDMKLIF